MINSLSLPGYQLVDSDEQNEDIHFRLEAPTPVACEGCGVQGEFVRFGKRDVPYRDLPIHGKRVTLWVVRRRYTCRACKTTFRPQRNRSLSGVLCPPAPTRNNPSHIHEGGTRSDQGDSDQQQVAAA